MICFYFHTPRKRNQAEDYTVYNVNFKEHKNNEVNVVKYEMDYIYGIYADQWDFGKYLGKDFGKDFDKDFGKVFGKDFGKDFGV